VYLPLGDFSFAEAAELLPSTEKPTGRADAFASPRLGLFNSAEFGYLLKQDSVNQAYLRSMARFFSIIWSPVRYRNRDSDDDVRVAASAGLFRMFDISRDATLSVRAEGLAYPQFGRGLAYASAQFGFGESVTVGAIGFLRRERKTRTTSPQSRSSPERRRSHTFRSIGFAGLTVSWIPVKSIALSASVLKRLEKGDYGKPRRSRRFRRL
jgi:hypothetical protein